MTIWRIENAMKNSLKFCERDLMFVWSFLKFCWTIFFSIKKHQQRPTIVEHSIYETCIFTADEILKTGLKLVGYKKCWICRAKKRANIEHFLRHFWGIPCICASILEDLQMTAVEEAWIPAEHLNDAFFLMAMRHLKRYPTEVKQERIFDISLKWGWDKVWD